MLRQDSIPGSIPYSVPLAFSMMAFISAAILLLYFFPFSQVHERSMTPVLQENDLVLLNYLAYRFSRVQVGDVVVLKAEDRAENTIKRCVLTPGMGMQWQNSRLFIPYWQRYVQIETSVLQELQGFPRVPQGFIFVLGDNLPDSVDSRSYGFVPVKNIRAKAIWQKPSKPLPDYIVRPTSG